MWRKNECDSFSSEKAISETNPEITQMLELADKNFKVASITMLRYLKENMLAINAKRGNTTRETKAKKCFTTETISTF